MRCRRVTVESAGSDSRDFGAKHLGHSEFVETADACISGPSPEVHCRWDTALARPDPSTEREREREGERERVRVSEFSEFSRRERRQR